MQIILGFGAAELLIEARPFLWPGHAGSNAIPLETLGDRR
jgi:hypothetical protein